jgi:hypothetical protein
MKVFLYELSILFSTQRHISAMHIVICSILHAPCVQITNTYLIYIPKIYKVLIIVESALSIFWTFVFLKQAMGSCNYFYDMLMQRCSFSTLLYFR